MNSNSHIVNDNNLFQLELRRAMQAYYAQNLIPNLLSLREAALTLNARSNGNPGATMRTIREQLEADFLDAARELAQFGVVSRPLQIDQNLWNKIVEVIRGTDNSRCIQTQAIVQSDALRGFSREEILQTVEAAIILRKLEHGHNPDSLCLPADNP
ncbi:hypothetical protein ACOTD7_19295 [Achromobacter xylosoxidans]